MSRVYIFLAVSSLLCCRSLLAQDKGRIVTLSEYFATIPFPENCSTVPIRPTETVERMIATVQAKAKDAADACTTFQKLTQQEAKRATEPEVRPLGEDVTVDVRFKRESKDTRQWIISNLRKFTFDVRDFLADSTISRLRRIGPETNWALLQGLLYPYASVSELKGRINVERFWRVSRTSGFALLPARLKDYMGAQMLSGNYLFMGPVVEGFRKDLESTSGAFRENPMLKELIRDSSSAPESLLRVVSPEGNPFHKLNDVVKADLIHLLFESWERGERESRISFFSQKPVWIGEIGLLALISQEDGSALHFLSRLNVSRLSQSERRAILFSLLEGGSSLDRGEIQKRSSYIEELQSDEQFTALTERIRIRLLQASRVPGIAMAGSSERFDFRERIALILEESRQMQDGEHFLTALADWYELVRMNWYLNPGNPALNFIPTSSRPILTGPAFVEAKRRVLYPDVGSARSLETMRFEAPDSRFNANAGIQLDADLFRLPYRAWLGGQSSRVWRAAEGVRFQTEDLHVRFFDDGEVSIAIPIAMKATEKARPPDLAFVITAIGRMPKNIRSGPRSIVLLPTTGEGNRRLLAYYDREENSINFLQVATSESWKGNFKPATVLFHEYAHLIFYWILRMDQRDSDLGAEYRLAKDADRSEVSKYGKEDASEDFAESFMLAHILLYAPSHELEGAFETLFPNRLDFLTKRVQKLWEVH